MVTVQKVALATMAVVIITDVNLTEYPRGGLVVRAAHRCLCS